MKKVIETHLPKIVHPSWINCPSFREDILNTIKSKLRLPINPEPEKIFESFGLSTDNIKLILVGETYPLKNKSKHLTEICKILEEEYDWDKAENYTKLDFSWWQDCLVLTTSLTERQPEIWKEFMTELFKWFGESEAQYVFCFLDERSFNGYAKYVNKKHEIVYKFQPKIIQEILTKKWGFHFYWGLPF